MALRSKTCKAYQIIFIFYFEYNDIFCKFYQEQAKVSYIQIVLLLLFYSFVLFKISEIPRTLKFYEGRPIVLATHLVPSLPIDLFQMLAEAIEAATNKQVVILYESKLDRPVAEEIVDIGNSGFLVQSYYLSVT